MNEQKAIMCVLVGTHKTERDPQMWYKYLSFARGWRDCFSVLSLLVVYFSANREFGFRSNKI